MRTTRIPEARSRKASQVIMLSYVKPLPLSEAFALLNHLAGPYGIKEGGRRWGAEGRPHGGG